MANPTSSTDSRDVQQRDRDFDAAQGYNLTGLNQLAIGFGGQAVPVAGFLLEVAGAVGISGSTATSFLRFFDGSTAANSGVVNEGRVRWNGTTKTMDFSAGSAFSSAYVHISAGYRSIEKYIAEGSVKCAITPGTIGRYWTDFAGFGDWTFQTFGTGAQTILTNRKGGVVQITTGATAASWSLASTPATLVGSGSASKWYMAFRFAVTTAIDAAAFVTAGVIDVPDLTVGVAKNLLYVGVNGPVSTTKYSFFLVKNGAGTFSLTSTINIDTAYHIFEAWQDGTTIFFSVDGETPLSAASAGNNGTALQMLPFIECFNGATAAARTGEFDWGVWLYEQGT